MNIIKKLIYSFMEGVRALILLLCGYSIAMADIHSGGWIAAHFPLNKSFMGFSFNSYIALAVVSLLVIEMIGDATSSASYRGYMKRLREKCSLIRNLSN